MLDRYAVEISEYENGVIDTGTGGIVPVCDAPLPIVYERATKALAECARIDECQDWANKAKALASYARQSKDDTLRKMADRIQARAIRRCGELLKQVEAGQGSRTDRLQEATLLKFVSTHPLLCFNLHQQFSAPFNRPSLNPAAVFNHLFVL